MKSAPSRGFSGVTSGQTSALISDLLTRIFLPSKKQNYNLFYARIKLTLPVLVTYLVFMDDKHGSLQQSSAPFSILEKALGGINDNP